MLAGFRIVGDAQVELTLGRMRRIVRKALAVPEFLWWARATVNTIAPDAVAKRQPERIAAAIRNYVAQRIRFVPDPVGIENLTNPLDHARLLQRAPRMVLLGDCDDAATLSAALAMAVGIPASFTVRAFRSATAPYQHVFTTLHPRGGKPVEVDTTREAQRLPPKPTRERTVRV